MQQGIIEGHHHGIDLFTAQPAKPYETPAIHARQTADVKID